MAFARPFAYNSGAQIPGTEQLGNLSIGAPTSGFTNSPQYWNGPDEELGYVIAQSVSGNTQPTPISGITASVGFFRSPLLTENSFVEFTNNLFGQNFSNGNEAVVWLNSNGYWTSFIPVTLTPTPTNNVTPTVTPTISLTPTNTPTITPTTTPTITPTISLTPTLTPTPSTSPIPVTGYGYNLVVFPYQAPTSGNTIFPTFATPGDMSGTTNPNTFTTNGVYWNRIDNTSVDRTNYYSGMTGVSVTAYFTQNGNTAIYSGSTSAFTIEGPPGQESFNYNPDTRPGQLVLIQSASTNFVTGQTVYISYVVNITPTPTPTPTRTSTTPTPTATPTLTPSLTPYTTLAGSLLFNGSNQSLGLSPGVTFGAGSFTLEGWFYNNALFNNVGIVGSPVTSPVGCLNLYFANGTTITSDRNGGGGSFSYTMSSSITANQWHYLIYNRNADGTTAVYIDGVRCIATSLDTLNYTTATDTIGRYYGGYWPGYWTNMRMTIGTAVYNSTLTTQSTPRGPLTSLANTKYLMLGAVVTTDSSGTQTVTNNNGVTQTSDEPF